MTVGGSARRGRRYVGAAGAAPDRHGLPGLRAVPAPHGRAERRLRAAARRGARRIHSARSSWSGCSTRPTATRTSSRAASASASRWPARWRPGRRSSCSTSRSRASTPRCARPAPRGRADPARCRRDRDPRDARPGGGALPRRPAGADARRAHRPGRRARGRLRPARRAVGRAVRGRGQRARRAWCAATGSTPRSAASTSAPPGRGARRVHMAVRPEQLELRAAGAERRGGRSASSAATTCSTGCVTRPAARCWCSCPRSSYTSPARRCSCARRRTRSRAWSTSARPALAVRSSSRPPGAARLLGRPRSPPSASGARRRGLRPAAVLPRAGAGGAGRAPLSEARLFANDLRRLTGRATPVLAGPGLVPRPGHESLRLGSSDRQARQRGLPPGGGRGAAHRSAHSGGRLLRHAQRPAAPAPPPHHSGRACARLAALPRARPDDRQRPQVLHPRLDPARDP